MRPLSVKKSESMVRRWEAVETAKRRVAMPSTGLKACVNERKWFCFREVIDVINRKMSRGTGGGVILAVARCVINHSLHYQKRRQTSLAITKIQFWENWSSH